MCAWTRTPPTACSFSGDVGLRTERRAHFSTREKYVNSKSSKIQCSQEVRDDKLISAWKGTYCKLMGEITYARCIYLLGRGQLCNLHPSTSRTPMPPLSSTLNFVLSTKLNFRDRRKHREREFSKPNETMQNAADDWWVSRVPWALPPSDALPILPSFSGLPWGSNLTTPSLAWEHGPEMIEQRSIALPYFLVRSTPKTLAQIRVSRG